VRFVYLARKGGLYFGTYYVTNGVLELPFEYLLLLLLLLLLLTAIELSLGGSSPYTSTEKSNKNKFT
jgi:hypothetical protein